ncbi:hypothetical protein TMatcc_010096 [Talaromyces marneffei ATCC 18224]|uniref:Uncharacterized protein n=1 Tax=Talaromyces marneffei (strain ATCC 18224 / CBS 334.59 / QM 7333) TaxID=441960 RepID=B6QTZ2_TALMQ|nr:conserved hypothetical protein [Talaromyces marneffei ATCC 18224]KAE8548240.1 hypothetical protein EYB25_010034 [Talaromyces marneffei]
MDTKTTEPLELMPYRIGPPRLSKESRILARFYEPLYLLRALGQTRGAHTPQPPSPNHITETRRRFLENLCFVCDFTRGGKSCTAIGLEECPDKYQFWVSSNGQNAKIAKFLEEVLEFLSCIGASTETELADTELATVNSNFVRLCAEFAKPRIEAERKLIQKQAEKCVSKIRNRMTEADGSSILIVVDNIDESHRIDLGNLVLMLENLINQKDPIRLCEFAHEHRQSTWVTDLKTLAFEDERELVPEAERSSFFSVRHYVGTLSRHIRAPRQLVEGSHNMRQILQIYTVMMVSPLAGVQLPLRDRHTNLRGIMNRMFKAHDVEKNMVEAGLVYLHRVSGVFDEFVTFYKESEGCVHAEIQVMEHFCQSQLAFAFNDRFIACSKPACLCCELYFKHHPARIVVPSSHRKVWTNWSPPRIEDFAAKEDMVIQQRQIMSKITHDVREQVIDQVLQRTSQIPWHPDSRTGITESLVTALQGISLDPQLSEVSDSDFDSDSVDSSESETWSDLEDGDVPLLA